MNNLQTKIDSPKEAFYEIGQEQVFRFWNDLNQSQRTGLLNQLKQISPEECLQAWSDIQDRAKKFTNPSPPIPESGIDPLNESLNEYWHLGEELISQNKVAAFTVAGGQGTRLGHNGPKGTLGCTPLKNSSLFEKFAGNLKFFAKRFGETPRWFIMTSHSNYQETVQFFSQHDYFGLNQGRVSFFKQGMMPVFDLGGKILLEQKDRILMSPNGHGGAFRALSDSGALSQMQQEEIEYLSYFQVDNPLVYCIDPTFIGLHHARKSEMSSKAVQKVHANEKVGTFVNLNGKLNVVEYSDIPHELSSELAETGDLKYRLGSIAIHLLNRSFIEKIAKTEEKQNRLHYHGALKSVSCLDREGKHQKPDSPNALKPETFIFDALPSAQNPLVLEIDRNEEFAPIKNPQGSDSLQSSHILQIQRNQKWLMEERFTEVPEKIEISPLCGPTRRHFTEQISKKPLNSKLLSKETLILENFEKTASNQENY